jgi:hypothetical protein
MTKETYIADLERRLAAITSRIQEMDIALSSCSLGQKVTAAGDLEIFKARRAELEIKISSLSREPPERWGRLRTEIAEDIDAFAAELKRFILGDRRFE